MILDSHIHSEFSFDSNFKIEEVLHIIQKSINGLILTEHVDLDYDLDDNVPVDFEKYFNTFSKYRNDNFLLGVEIGMPVNYLLETEELVSKYNFDLVIGSIHSINNIDICMIYSRNSLDKRDMHINYFNEMIKSVKAYNNFDSLGHIDYISRYTNFNNNEIIFSESKEAIAEILNTIINKNKVLELNTRRINNKSSYDSIIPIYSLYKDLGGKYITIGSDAHNKNDVFKNFDIAYNFADSLGLKVVYFKDRKIKGMITKH